MFEGLTEASGAAPTSNVALAVAVTPESLLTRYTYQAIGAAVPSGNVSLTTGTGFPQAYARRLVVGTAGVLYVKRINDSGYTYYAVSAGQVIDGMIVGIGGSVTGTTATYVNAEY